MGVKSIGISLPFALHKRARWLGAVTVKLFESQRDKHPHVRPEIGSERREFIVELSQLSSLLSELSSVLRQVIADRALGA